MRLWESKKRCLTLHKRFHGWVQQFDKKIANYIHMYLQPFKIIALVLNRNSQLATFFTLVSVIIIIMFLCILC